MKNRFTDFLPSIVRMRLEERPYLLNLISNTNWLLADKIIRMGMGLLVGVWVARYLGPERFGLLNYAYAFAGLFAAIATLGLDSVAVRNIVTDPSCRDETLGTTFLLKLLGAAITFCFTVGAILLLRPGDRLSHWLVGIVAAGTIFQAFDAIDFWFQSQVLSKYSICAKNGSFLLISLGKVVLILLKAPLIAFALAGLAEIALGSVGLLAAYRINGRHLEEWRFRYEVAKRLLKDSWPLVLSGVAVMIFLRIDQVMLGSMMGNKEVGIYSAAVTLSEVWYFIPMAIASSVFPAIVLMKNKSKLSYYEGLKKLYLLMFWLSLVVAIPVSIFSKDIVTISFGEQYAYASTALSINCWAGLFIFSGLVDNHWCLLENLSRYTFYRAFVGAIVNILLNLFLIPHYGINGAAIATLITQFVSSYLIYLINAPTRVLFIIKTRMFFLFLPITISYISKHMPVGKK